MTDRIEHPHDLIQAGRKLKEMEHKLNISEAKRAELIEGNIKLKEALQEVRLQVGVLSHNWNYREKIFMPKVIKALK